MVRHISIVFLFVFFTFFISCDRKLEVVKSNVTTNLYFIKNTNKDNIEEVKSIVKSIVDSTPKSDRIVISFYKYTSDFGPFFRGTAYFINNKEILDGFGIELLDDHEKEEIARYGVFKGENGRSKYFRFYNEYR
jgi:hypothetical protein